MKYIGGCARLKRLDLSKNPGVGDDSIPYLKQLKQLRVLSIDDTSITPQGLLKLKGAGFTSLVLSQGKISRAQLAQIHSAFPKAHIGYRGGAKAVDEETGTLWGQMSRQRKF